MTRQKLVGWLLIVVSGAYLVYFLKVRLFTPGPFIENGSGCTPSGRSPR
jgi:hypothetical protein